MAFTIHFLPTPAHVHSGFFKEAEALSPALLSSELPSPNLLCLSAAMEASSSAPPNSSVLHIARFQSCFSICRCLYQQPLLLVPMFCVIPVLSCEGGLAPSSEQVWEPLGVTLPQEQGGRELPGGGNENAEVRVA